MARSYKTPKVIIMDIGDDDPIVINASGAGEVPNVKQASFSAWRMAVQNANLDIDQSYAGYVDWMVKNGYAAYIQPDDSELQ